MNLIKGLNIEYIRVYDNDLEAKMNLTDFHDQTFGYLHGGATIAFGETIAGYASNEKIDKGQIAVGQTITANHMKPKKIEGYIMAKGRLLHKGRTCHVWRIEMFDENNILISYITVTNSIIKSNKD
ncbi:PaaI family thioesterase [Anaeromicrobium sediminis]|uniref:1,4-dihydroxy-2-naphthoyl-CoA hydrolase n=1 Tax=Anaeromicrobium sediminis TaxID=1478221 RepID=A0A267MFS0_9FIRM|nr:PaaI family thioesterase [Anaeromicrobium sediminis]PAB58396.1 1,4-dihydroxy-2-naphthoyl-CoA hydrolase [Anaeromicrobium sediminis]